MRWPDDPMLSDSATWFHDTLPSSYALRLDDLISWTDDTKHWRLNDFRSFLCPVFPSCSALADFVHTFLLLPPHDGWPNDVMLHDWTPQLNDTKIKRFDDFTVFPSSLSCRLLCSVWICTCFLALLLLSTTGLLDDFTIPDAITSFVAWHSTFDDPMIDDPPRPPDDRNVSLHDDWWLTNLETWSMNLMISRSQPCVTQYNFPTDVFLLLMFACNWFGNTCALAKLPSISCTKRRLYTVMMIDDAFALQEHMISRF